jgi:hypothetical protein
VISVRATDWIGSRHRFWGSLEDLELVGLSELYDKPRATLPTLAMTVSLDPRRLTMPSATDRFEPVRAVACLFEGQSGAAVLALVIDLATRISDASEDHIGAVLDAELDWTFTGPDGSIPLMAHLAHVAQSSGAMIDGDQAIAASTPMERHQVILATHPPEGPDADAVVSRLLQRRVPPSQRPLITMTRLATQDDRLAVVTARTSLLCGYPGSFESGTLLSGVQIVGAAAQCRRIASGLAGSALQFRREKQAYVVGVQQHGDFEVLLDEIGNLELSLGFDVEYPLAFGLLIPDPELEDFSRALTNQMKIPDQALAASQMLARVKASVDSEMAAIDIRQRVKDEMARARRAPALITAGWVGALSGIVGVLAVLVTVFNVPSSYAAGLTILPVAVGFAVHYAWVRLPPFARVRALRPFARVRALRPFARVRARRRRRRSHTW